MSRLELGLHEPADVGLTDAPGQGVDRQVLSVESIGFITADYARDAPTERSDFPHDYEVFFSASAVQKLNGECGKFVLGISGQHSYGGNPVLRVFGDDPPRKHPLVQRYSAIGMGGNGDAPPHDRLFVTTRVDGYDVRKSGMFGQRGARLRFSRNFMNNWVATGHGSRPLFVTVKSDGQHLNIVPIDLDIPCSDQVACMAVARGWFTKEWSMLDSITVPGRHVAGATVRHAMAGPPRTPLSLRDIDSHLTSLALGGIGFGAYGISVPGLYDTHEAPRGRQTVPRPAAAGPESDLHIDEHGRDGAARDEYRELGPSAEYDDEQ